jgi:uroporphyrinogen-III synthase/uroporphyrinogen III methyltransferase/synthase
MSDVREPHPSLAGRRVAVTRAARHGEDPLAVALAGLGAEVFEAPATAIGPPSSWEALDGALRRLETFDWLAFASATAVDAVVERCRFLGVDPAALGRLRLAAVGPATARRVSAVLRTPDVVPVEARGEAMAAALAAALRGPSIGRRVLVPRAAGGRPELLDGLAVAGAEVSAPEAYRTVALDPAELAPLVERLEQGTLDAVVFTAPSAVQSVTSALGERCALLDRVVLAAMGPTTRAALAERGFAVRVEPREPTLVGLAQALARHFGGSAR